MLDFGDDNPWDRVVGHPDQVVVNLDIDVAGLEFRPRVAVSLVLCLFLENLFVSVALGENLVQIVQVMLVIGVSDPVDFVEPASIFDKVVHQEAVKDLTSVSPAIKYHAYHFKAGRFHEMRSSQSGFVASLTRRR